MNINVDSIVLLNL